MTNGGKIKREKKSCHDILSDSFSFPSLSLSQPSAEWSPGAAGAAPVVAEDRARAEKPVTSVASPLAAAAAVVGPAEVGILVGATLRV